MHIFHFKCLHSKSCCGKWEIQFLNRLSFIDTCTNSLVIKCHANDAYDIMILLHEFSIGQLSTHEYYLNISVTRKSTCALQRRKKKTTIYHKRSHAIFKYDLRDMQKEKNNYHTSSLTLLVTTRLHRQCWLLRIEIASRNTCWRVCTTCAQLEDWPTRASRRRGGRAIEGCVAAGEGGVIYCFFLPHRSRGSGNRGFRHTDSM